jgi:hypothetical protein
MKNLKILVLFLLVMISGWAYSKPILIVTTDIGQDPDDQQSFVRLLHYADKFQIAGIIANADVNYDYEAPVLRDDIIHRLIDAYGQIENNLRVHSPEFPSACYLHSIVKKGCTGNGTEIAVEQFVGSGKDTEGSEWIIKVVDNCSNEPVNISVWGGACDLAQALWKVKANRNSSEVNRFVSRLRVYFIGKQDSSNDWIMENFPELWLILSDAHSHNKWESTYRGVFLGGDMELTSGEWLKKHILGKNPLANLYPDKAYTGSADQNPHGAMKEGDTPSILFLIENGLNTLENPEWGGWGGRYLRTKQSLFRDIPDSVFDAILSKQVSSPLATIYRWRTDFQNDFASRVQWGTTNQYTQANHYPVVCIVGFSGNKHLEVSVKKGEEISFDASCSFDPDNNHLNFEWFFYPEAGDVPLINKVIIQGQNTSKIKFIIPESACGKNIHLILRVSDDSSYPLTSYKRIILTVE